MKKTTKSIVLILINNERKNKRVLSAKGCNPSVYFDIADCKNGATDICLREDVSACAGEHAYDYCKYVDRSDCEGNNAFDYCYNDYDDCNYNGFDYCGTD